MRLQGSVHAASRQTWHISTAIVCQAPAWQHRQEDEGYTCPSSQAVFTCCYLKSRTILVEPRPSQASFNMMQCRQEPGREDRPNTEEVEPLAGRGDHGVRCVLRKLPAAGGPGARSAASGAQIQSSSISSSKCGPHSGLGFFFFLKEATCRGAWGRECSLEHRGSTTGPAPSAAASVV